MNSKDPIVAVLEDLIENGGEIPQRVTNRMVLAAAIKGIEISQDNTDLIDRNLEVVKEEFEKTNGRVEELEKFEVLNNEAREHQKDHCDELKTTAKWRYVYLALSAIIVFILAWHTGVDLGWWPGLVIP